MKALCVVCRERPMVGIPLCEPCGRSYDRSLAKDVSIAACIEWAANRTRRFERKRVHESVTRKAP